MKDDRILEVSDDTREAVEPIYRQYYQEVFNYVKYVTRNHADAGIVASDVFAKIMNLYGKPQTRFDGEKAALGSWVHTVANSVVLDFFRTNHQDRYSKVSDYVDREGNEFFQFCAPALQSPQKQMENDELSSRLKKAFSELKPKYRKIADMYFVGGDSYKQISDALDIPMGTVKGMISRARTKLQQELDGMYVQKTQREMA